MRRSPCALGDHAHGRSGEARTSVRASHDSSAYFGFGLPGCGEPPGFVGGLADGNGLPGRGGCCWGGFGGGGLPFWGCEGCEGFPGPVMVYLHALLGAVWVGGCAMRLRTTRLWSNLIQFDIILGNSK